MSIGDLDLVLDLEVTCSPDLSGVELGDLVESLDSTLLVGVAFFRRTAAGLRLEKIGLACLGGCLLVGLPGCLSIISKTLIVALSS